MSQKTDQKTEEAKQGPKGENPPVEKVAEKVMQGRKTFQGKGQEKRG